ncbi:DNA-binding TFAR19-related protein, PDSD5 family [Halanaeroarchaeum sp. HSR-CO]|uniref:DNA-binding protein n=1 Tax=Halanaeroarchaeum sp. HSR-CO TaxID=2866382 RepID=UPI00217CD938|nr:DNA-binding protein [Halanaeroarchaeum sp. HSR-CO]UWG46533.1 DNA-binding TFAR19-related protein, PDSD5 family [Halanaeroarchaeum sp. HSR-CO]
MSQGPDDDRLEQLREEKLQELQQQQGGEGQEEAVQAQREQAEAQKNALLKQHLTDGARKRLNTVKMSRPDFGEQVEQQVVALAQSGRLRDKIDEAKMKELLNELKPDSTSFNIERR